MTRRLVMPFLFVATALWAMPARAANDATAESKVIPVRAADDVIAEKDMDSARLVALFKTAFMKADLDEKGDVRVEDANMKIYVKVSNDRKFLIFIATFRFKESASRLAMLELVNRINDKNIFARAAVTTDNGLWFDYFLSYEQGLQAHQIVTAYKWFSKAVTGSLDKHDTEDIVK